MERKKDTEPKERQEITLNDLEKLKDSPVGDYFSIDPDGNGVFLHDVLTLEPLEYGTVPEAITRTPELNAGLQYLQALAQNDRLVVQLVLGPHGAAEDFERMARDHPSVLSAPLVGLEMTGNSDGSLVVADAPGRSSFQTKQLQWARRSSKTIFPCELQGDDENELLGSMNRLWDGIVAPALSCRRDDPMARVTAAIAERSYQAVRQWSILARLGSHLARYDTQGQLPAHERLHVPLVLGSWHAPSADRLGMLGVPSEVYYSEPDNYDQAFKEYGEMAMATTLLGYAPMEFLRAPLPY